MNPLDNTLNAEPVRQAGRQAWAMNYDTDLQRTEYRLPRFQWVRQCYGDTGSQSRDLAVQEQNIIIFITDGKISVSIKRFIIFDIS